MKNTFPVSLKKVEELMESIKSWCSNLLNSHNTSIDSHPDGFNNLHSMNSITIETLSTDDVEPVLILKTNNSRTTPSKGRIAYTNANNESICVIDCDYIDTSDGYAFEVHLAHTPPVGASNVVMRITNSKEHGMRTFIFGELYVNGKLIG